MAIVSGESDALPMGSQHSNLRQCACSAVLHLPVGGPALYRHQCQIEDQFARAALRNQFG